MVVVCAIQPALVSKRSGNIARRSDRLLVRLGFDDFLAAVKTGWADVMPKMHFAGGGLNSDRGGGYEIMRAMHATLGRRFFILLDGHLAAPKLDQKSGR
jgi:hypothetical protein